MADVCKWNLEFSFRDDRRCKKFIKKLLRLPYTLKFTYYEYDSGDGDRYHIEIEGNYADTLTVVSKIIEKVDFKHK